MKTVFAEAAFLREAEEVQGLPKILPGASVAFILKARNLKGRRGVETHIAAATTDIGVAKDWMVSGVLPDQETDSFSFIMEAVALAPEVQVDL